MVVIVLVIIVSGKMSFDNRPEVNSNKADEVVEITNAKQKPICPREYAYNNSPEFERGLSLLYQRIEENPRAPYVSEQERYTMDLLLQIRNCLNIQFSDSIKDNTEGYFVFDPESTVENLQIFVDKKYTGYDDALTALLLAHEVTHATQFVDFRINNKDKTCIDKEVEAIKMELQLIRFFNDEEKRSLSSRDKLERQFNTEHGLSEIYEESALNSVRELFNINTAVGPMCNTPTTGDFETWMTKDEECHDKKKTEYIRKLLLNSPQYQKQCGI